MKYIKNLLLFSFVSTMSCTGADQKQTFDVVTYSVPKGWSKAASGKINEWGKLIKASEYKLGKAIYSFDIEL